jgi:hypothetical protein
MKNLEIEITYKAKYNFNVDAKTDEEALEIYKREQDKIIETLMENFEYCINEELINVELTNIKDLK